MTQARELGERALARAADPGRAAARRRGIASIVTAGLPTIGAPGAGPSGDAGAAARRRASARRALGQRQRLDQPDARRACAEEPRRPDPADHRRRRRPSAASNRRSSPRPAARSGCFGPDRSRSMPNEASAARIEAPGQLASHYAPSKPLRLDATERRAGEFLIGFGAIAGDASLSPSGDLVEAAARLFDLLHQADASRQAAHRRRAGPGRRPRRRDQRPASPSARRLGGASALLTRAWKLLRSFCSLGGMTADAIGIALPLARPIILVIILGRIPFALAARSSSRPCRRSPALARAIAARAPCAPARRPAGRSPSDIACRRHCPGG